MIWYDVIWYDIIWYDIIWYDMIWFDMIRCNMVWYDNGTDDLTCCYPSSGVVGPTCSQGNSKILTHDFASRLHMDLFNVRSTLSQPTSLPTLLYFTSSLLAIPYLALSCPALTKLILPHLPLIQPFPPSLSIAIGLSPSSIVNSIFYSFFYFLCICLNFNLIGCLHCPYTCFSISCIFQMNYYPPQLTDWWMDDWISLVYGMSRTFKASDIRVLHHTGEPS